MASLYGGRAVPAGGFERFAWFFMRISGVFLLLLALGHLAIMHLINSIEDVNYAFVAARYAKPFWRTYDGLMLVLALVHGWNGMRVILNDHLRGAWRLFVVWTSGIVATAFLILGLWVIFTFQPVTTPPTPHVQNIPAPL